MSPRLLAFCSNSSFLEPIFCWALFSCCCASERASLTFCMSLLAPSMSPFFIFSAASLADSEAFSAISVAFSAPSDVLFSSISCEPVCCSISFVSLSVSRARSEMSLASFFSSSAAAFFPASSPFFAASSAFFSISSWRLARSLPFSSSSFAFSICLSRFFSRSSFMASLTSSRSFFSSSSSVFASISPFSASSASAFSRSTRSCIFCSSSAALVRRSNLRFASSKALMAVSVSLASVLHASLFSFQRDMRNTSSEPWRIGVTCLSRIGLNISAPVSRRLSRRPSMKSERRASAFCIADRALSLDLTASERCQVFFSAFAYDPLDPSKFFLAVLRWSTMFCMSFLAPSICALSDCRPNDFASLLPTRLTITSGV